MPEKKVSDGAASIPLRQLFPALLIQRKMRVARICQFIVNAVVQRSIQVTEGRKMTGKMSIGLVLLVWLGYVAWMVNYYAGTFSLFSH